MSTPKDSVLNRVYDNTDRLADVIFENESLKIEVQTLQEELNSSGIAEMRVLREENRRLNLEVSELRVQAEEKAKQLETFQNSSTQLTTIDSALQRLLVQLQEQRAELSDMKQATSDKESRIIELTLKLEQAERLSEERKRRIEQYNDQFHTQTEQSAQDKAGWETERQALSAQVQQLQDSFQTVEAQVSSATTRATTAEKELLQLKEENAANSRARNNGQSAQADEIVQLREQAVQLQQQRNTLEERVAAVTAELTSLKTEHHRLQQEKDEAVSKALAATPAPPSPSPPAQVLDTYAPQVQAYVAQRVREATESQEARLREQTEKNRELMSRMSLVQMECEAAMKKTGLTKRDLDVVNERVEYASKRNNARDSIQRRVENLMQNATLTKEDISLFVQEVFDYQERVEQDTSTQILILEMQAEEREKVLRWNAKRLQSENESLMKQLQVHLFSTRETSESGGGGATSPRRSPLTGAAIAAPANPNGAPTPPRLISSNAIGNPNARNGHWTPDTDAAPHHTRHYADPNSSGANAMGMPPQKPHRPPMQPTDSRLVIVDCPSCTYRQPYGNGKCEICEVALVLPP